ncbi:uncharacterized protein LOC130897840 isoform X1 [Diorhabda carinulata]|uniref:uncharacterized protein LOC130897840 isoform X1 n=1 Tax=Diorhabda carinulata TaxID=1163345 RepID=UPI0025A12C69|nr:uncharacterized protein LOC130897840 isoform X1 [Diorhabda carinulata]
MVILIFIFPIQSVLLISGVLSEYEVPKAHLRILKPKGFTVSIPHEDGVELFAFHGNLNKPLDNLEAGRYSKDILKHSGGKWVFEDRQTELKKGDVIYYWLFVIRNHLGYRSDLQEFHINDDEDITSKSPESSRESNFYASFGQQFHLDNENESGYKIALKVSNIAMELYEEVKKLREINDILKTIIGRDEINSKTLRFEGILPGFDDAVYNAQIIMKDKLGITVRVLNATRNTDKSITFLVPSLNEKIYVIRTAKTALNGSKIKLTY